MTNGKVPTKLDPDRALISEVAMDIGKETVAYIEVMYPGMFEAVASTARLAIRNHIHNDIMAALETIDADEIRERLERRKRFRREWLKTYRDMRKEDILK